MHHMKVIELDLDERLYHLFMEIKHLVEHNNITKSVVLQDFIHIIMADFDKEKHEDN